MWKEVGIEYNRRPTISTNQEPYNNIDDELGHTQTDRYLLEKRDKGEEKKEEEALDSAMYCTTRRQLERRKSREEKQRGGKYGEERMEQKKKEQRLALQRSSVEGHEGEGGRKSCGLVLHCVVMKLVPVRFSAALEIYR